MRAADSATRAKSSAHSNTCVRVAPSGSNTTCVRVEHAGSNIQLLKHTCSWLCVLVYHTERVTPLTALPPSLLRRTVYAMCVCFAVRGLYLIIAAQPPLLRPCRSPRPPRPPAATAVGTAAAPWRLRRRGGRGLLLLRRGGRQPLLRLPQLCPLLRPLLLVLATWRQL